MDILTLAQSYWAGQTRNKQPKDADEAVRFIRKQIPQLQGGALRGGAPIKAFCTSALVKNVKRSKLNEKLDKKVTDALAKYQLLKVTKQAPPSMSAEYPGKACIRADVNSGNTLQDMLQRNEVTQDAYDRMLKTAICDFRGVILPIKDSAVAMKADSDDYKYVWVPRVLSVIPQKLRMSTMPLNVYRALQKAEFGGIEGLTGINVSKLPKNEPRSLLTRRQILNEYKSLVEAMRKDIKRGIMKRDVVIDCPKVMKAINDGELAPEAAILKGINIGLRASDIKAYFKGSLDNARKVVNKDQAQPSQADATRALNSVLIPLHAAHYLDESLECMMMTYFDSGKPSRESLKKDDSLLPLFRKARGNNAPKCAYSPSTSWVHEDLVKKDSIGRRRRITPEMAKWWKSFSKKVARTQKESIKKLMHL